MIFVLFGHILDILILSKKNPNRIKLDDKKLFTEIYEKLKNFKFPLEINKANIKKIEGILKINIYILASDENDNIVSMFSSENIYEKYLNLFYYKDHICYIKDLNSYLYSNNKSKKRKYFCNTCLMIRGEKLFQNHLFKTLQKINMEAR